jgi:hypothetical protein
MVQCRHHNDSVTVNTGMKARNISMEPVSFACLVTFADTLTLRCMTRIIEHCISRRMRWAGHVARMGRKEKCIQDFGG